MRLMGLGLRDFLRSLNPALVSVALMTAGLLAFRYVYYLNFSSAIIYLLAAVLLGLVIYAASLFLGFRAVTAEGWNLLVSSIRDFMSSRQDALTVMGEKTGAGPLG